MAKKTKEQAFEVGDFYDEQIASLSLQERRDVMEGIAYKAATGGYTKKLSSEEISEKKTKLAEVSIIIADLEAKKKEIMAELKAEIEPSVMEKGELLKALKYKSEYRTGTIYSIDDQENGLMYLFDENAECIEVRPLRQDEKQTKIKHLNSGTNG